MSAIPVEDEQSWRAPGVGADASPLVAALLRRLARVLGELHEVSFGALADADVARLVDDITAASSRVASLACRSVAEADRRRLGDEIGARHTHQWWASRSRLSHPEASRLARLGTALETEQHLPVARELAAGSLRVEQARVIVDSPSSGATTSRIRLQTARRRLHRPRLRDHRLGLPRPPRRPVGPQREHRPGPRLPLRHHHPR